MARTEIISKRQARSKTFRNDDGTYTFEMGGDIAHHQKDGAWVETQTNWIENSTELISPEHPYIVRLNKGSNAVVVFPIGGTPVTYAPLRRNNKADATYSGNTITIPSMWKGVDLKLILVPEGVIFQFIKTADIFDQPGFTCTGGDGSIMASAGYKDASGERIEIPATYQYGMVNYDLTNVPIGAVVE